MSDDDIEGLVLAGGRGTRMGGVDKGLVALDGVPLVEHVVRRLRPQVQRLAIGTSSDHPLYARLADRCVPDAPGETGRGPLAGLAAALRSTPCGWVAVAPCDAPRLPVDLVARLRAAWREPSQVCVAATPDGAGGWHWQPACALVRRDASRHLDAALAAGLHAMHRWIASVPHVVVPFDDALAFVNVNTRDDLAALEPGRDIGRGRGRFAA